MAIRSIEKKLWALEAFTGRLRANFGAPKTLVLGLILAILGGCSSWYVETGPIHDFGEGADNADVPWLVEGGVRWGACRVGVTHVSSILAGKPFDPGERDSYRLTGLSGRCGFGPGL